jgi:1-acyl-sn-glycerol-3-phosphate acyltransferase
MRVRLLRWFFSSLIKLLSRSRAEGLENLPARGPYILVSNHMSMADIPLGYTYVGGEHLAGWVAEKWRTNPLLWPILRMARGIFIRRGEVDRGALEAAASWLREGKIFALAPEGTRSRDGRLQRGKTGAAYLAQLADVPLVPVAVIGTERAIYSLFRLRRPELTLRVGRPFRLPPPSSAERSSELRRHTDEIMCRIAALLPPHNRGVYAEHPRLTELLDHPDTSAAPGQPSHLSATPPARP